MFRPPAIGRLLLHTLGLGGVGLLSVASLGPTLSSQYQSLSGLGADNLLDGGGGGQFIGGKAQPLDPQVLRAKQNGVKKADGPAKESAQGGAIATVPSPLANPSSPQPSQSSPSRLSPKATGSAVPPNGAFKDEAAFWLQGGGGPDKPDLSDKLAKSVIAQGKPTPPGAVVPQSVFQKLYQGPTSLGVVAVGVAEGTYKLMVKEGSLYVQPTRAYYGHIDPGNLSWGERVTNYGPCSDQGRSGGNLLLAAQQCVRRLADRLPTLLGDFAQSGMDPREDLEGLLNGADLYNQASPIHSRVYPQALAIARKGGLSGLEAYAWARTASFYLDDKKRLDLENGTNRASGLIGICRRERSASTQWECVYRDQARRVGAIASVYRQFLRLSEQS